MKAQFKQSAFLGSLAFSVLLASVGTSMANLALPAIAADFGISFSTARWVIVAYLLATTLFGLLVGLLGDLKGRAKVLLWGTALFAIGALVSGFSDLFWILISARIVQGVGAATLIVLPMAIATGMVRRKKTGRVIGLLATMSAVGTASGPSLGGLVLEAGGWRSVFFLMTVLGIFNLCFLFRFARLNEGSQAQMRRDLVSFDSSLVAQLISNFIISAVMMTTLIVGPFYLSHDLHLSPARMGLIMSVGPITSMFSGVISGYVVDRYGSRLVVGIGYVQLLIGAVSFVLLPAQFGDRGFSGSAVLLSLGYQLFLSANSKSLLENASPERRGSVSGALSLSRNLGLIAGTIVMGGIFDSKGLQMTFLFAAALITPLLVNHLRKPREI